MLFRFFVLGLLIALVYRLAKRFFKALIRSALNQKSLLLKNQSRPGMWTSPESKMQNSVTWTPNS